MTGQANIFKAGSQKRSSSRLYCTLFYFCSFPFDRNEPHIHPFKVVAFVNYAIGALVINYVLLPHFFYRKKYLQFFASLAVVVAIIIVVEEFVLEQIYYPDTRGKRFPGSLSIAYWT